MTAALLAAVPVPASGQPRPLPGDAAPVAGGGGFVIQSCGESGASDGWTATNTNASALSTGVDCPPSKRGGLYQSFQQAGLWVSDRLGNAGGAIEANAGDRAELTFTPLAGTTITRLRFWRYIVKAADNNWLPYISVGTRANIIDTCENDPSGGCEVGGSDWYPDDNSFVNHRGAYNDLQGQSAGAIIIGASCRDNEVHTCGNGYSLNNVDVQLLSAFLTISDSGAPTTGTPGGQAWTDTGWVSGTVPVTLASTDLTGIRATRAYLDDNLLATTARSCSYTRPRPCSDESGATVNVPTAGLADGPHTLAVGALDAANNEARVTRSTPIKVDNNAPAAPVGLSSPTPVSQTNSFSASWALPADSGAPITTARYQLCQNGSCGSIGTAPTLTSVSGLALPAAGSATLRVWLVDQLGHANAAAPAMTTLTYSPVVEEPPAETATAPPDSTTTTTSTQTPPTTTLPAPAPGPPLVRRTSPALTLTTLRRVGRKVTIAGRLASSASGTVTIRYRVRHRGHTHTLTKRVTIARHAFRTTLALSPTYAKARSATVSVAYAGDADTTPQTRTRTLRTTR